MVGKKKKGLRPTKQPPDKVHKVNTTVPTKRQG